MATATALRCNHLDGQVATQVFGGGDLAQNTKQDVEVGAEVGAKIAARLKANLYLMGRGSRLCRSASCGMIDPHHVRNTRAGQQSVDRESTGSFDENHRTEAQGQQMKFNPFAPLGACPIHEKADVAVNHGNCNRHVAHDSEGGDATQQPHDQAQTAEELGRDGKQGKHNWNVHFIRETSHGDTEPRTAKPSKYLLCAVGEKHNAQKQASDGEGVIVAGVENLSEHVRLQVESAAENPAGLLAA
jgi:hypothetical protein